MYFGEEGWESVINDDELVFGNQLGGGGNALEDQEDDASNVVEAFVRRVLANLKVFIEIFNEDFTNELELELRGVGDLEQDV